MTDSSEQIKPSLVKLPNKMDLPPQPNRRRSNLRKQAIPIDEYKESKNLGRRAFLKGVAAGAAATLGLGAGKTVVDNRGKVGQYLSDLEERDRKVSNPGGPPKIAN